MARELVLEATLESVEAEASLARLHAAFMKAGDSAEVAQAKVDKFEKTYKDGRARQAAKKELDDLAKSTTGAGSAAQKAATDTSLLTSAVMRFAAPAAVGAAIMRTLNWADSVSDLANKHRMSTDAVQQLTVVAEKNGATFGRYAGLMETAADRIAKGSKRTTDALAEMGLEAAELRGLDPYTITSEIAKGLDEIDDPARRAAIRMALFGESGGDALQMVNALNEGIEKLAPTVDKDMVEAGDKAIEMWGRFKNVVMATTNEAILQSIAPLVSIISYFDDLTTSLDEASVSAARLAALLPARPGGFGGAGALPVPGDPMGGLNGQSWDFLNKSLTPKIARERAAAGGARVPPFTQSTFALGSTAAAIFGMANTPGGFSAGSLPFLASLPPLRSGAGPISFANGSTLAGTVPMNAPMNAPGGGGGLSGFLSGRGGAIAGAGLSFLTQAFGSKLGLSQGGSQIGSLIGSLTPLGPLGGALGGIAGGLIGKLFGGNKDAKQINQIKASDDFQQMAKQAAELGVSMDKVFQARKLKDFEKAVQDVTKRIGEMAAKKAEIESLKDEIAALTQATTVDFDKMNAIVNEFGLDVAKLGPAFQQAMSDKEAQRIIDAMAIMEKGGADMNGVLEGMADELSTLVQNAIKFGTTIPENMKPWIESLIKQGKLLDENGQAITDISKVKFGAAMESDMSKLTKKLDEMVAKLGELVDKFNAARDAADGFAGAAENAGNAPNPGEGGQSQNGSGSPGFATGGVAGRDFRRPGYGDVFPALLRRGERVLPPGVSGGGVSLTIGNLSVGGGYGSRADAVEEIGNSVVAYLERRGARLVA